MGPNGSGKSTLSHVLMGKPGYEVTGGSVTLDGVDLLALPTWKRAQAGLFLAMQYPTEVPGVALTAVLEEALVAAGRVHGRAARSAARRERPHRLRRPLPRPAAQRRPLRRREEAQRDAAARRAAAQDRHPRRARLRASTSTRCVPCSRRIEEATNEGGLGVLAITHYSRLLHELQPDLVHVLIRGRIERSGGPELAMQLESTGYSDFGVDDERADAPPIRSPTRWAILLPRRADLSLRPMRVRIVIACVVAALAIVAGVVLWPKGGKAATRVEVAPTHDHDAPRSPRRRPRRRRRRRRRRPPPAAPVRSSRCHRPRGESVRRAGAAAATGVDAQPDRRACAARVPRQGARPARLAAGADSRGGPTSATAWIHAEDVGVRGVDNRIVIEREARRLTVYRGMSDEVLFQAPVATGAPKTPTPLGDFFIDIVVKLTQYEGRLRPLPAERGGVLGRAADASKAGLARSRSTARTVPISSASS